MAFDGRRQSTVVAVLLLELTLTGCRSIQLPHPRALECNDLCALHAYRGELTAAEDQCDLGIDFSPQYADLWVNKAVIASKRGQISLTKELLIKALRLNEDQAQAYNDLGLIYLQDEKAYGKAHDNFRRALRVNPDYLEARFNLALTFKAMHDCEKARKELRTLLNVNPSLSKPYAQLGQIAFEENEFESAVEALTKAVQLDPSYAHAWLALGNAYMELGRPCEAKDAFSSCIDADEANPSCRNNIIVAQRMRQLQNQALPGEQQATTRQPLVRD